MIENLQKYRFLQESLPHPGSKRLVLITGARQTGKTTLARKVYASLNYINLDAPENRDVVREIPSAAWGRDIGAADWLSIGAKKLLIWANRISGRFLPGGCLPDNAIKNNLLS